jgi:ribosomal protein S15P/S13E
MDRSLYPENWDEIAMAAKERAGWRCESCGLENGAMIKRNSLDPSEFQIWDEDFGLWRAADGRELSDHEVWHRAQTIVIVMTTHHVGVPLPDGTPGDPANKMDNRPENLQCLCQRCHLVADLKGHMEASKKTRHLKKELARLEAGQKRMWNESTDAPTLSRAK